MKQGDENFNSVVDGLVSNIDNTVTALRSATIAETTAETLARVHLNTGDRSLGKKEINLLLGKYSGDHKAAAFVLQSDRNRNIFVTNKFPRSAIQQINALIHEGSHFHPNGYGGGMVHPGDTSAMRGPGAIHNPYNFSRNRKGQTRSI